jgi:hypothetical protein
MDKENGRIPNAVVAVPLDMVEELEGNGLASPLPIFRGAVVEVLVTIGMDSAMLVTLLQTPESVRAFATYIRARCTRTGNTIQISAKRGNKQVHITVDGDIDVAIVADFLTAAFADRPTQS